MDKRKEYNVKDSSKTFLWALLLPQILAFFVVLIFSFFYETSEELSNSMIYLIVSSMIAQISFVLVYFVYNKKNNINFIEASKLKTKFDVKNVILCVVISVIAIFGLYNFVSLFDMLFEKIGFNLASFGLPLTNFGWFIVNVILLAIVPAIFEELIFRGVIFNGLRKRGFWFACLISSLLFALVHGSVSQLIYPMIMGIIFCLILEKTGSTIYGMIVHLCNNFIVLLISYISEIRGSVPSFLIVDSISKGFMAVFVAMLALFSIWCIIKYFIKGKSEEHKIIEEKTIDKNSKIYLIVAIVVGVALWVTMVVTSNVG